MHQFCPAKYFKAVAQAASTFAFFYIQAMQSSPVALAQNATVTNNAAPNANVSTNTSGGTNINQQLNNVYDTSYGFGPGIICRTPQLLINGTYGGSNSNLNVFPTASGNAQYASSYSASLGVAIPLGSTVIADCERYAAQIAEDRMISSELSLIRACAQLERDGLKINPAKYPLLSKCLDPVAATRPIAPQAVPVRPNQPIQNSPQPQPAQRPTQRFNP